MSEGFKKEFESFSSEMLRHQGKVIQALDDQSRQIDGVGKKLDTHLNEHQHVLERRVEMEQERGSKKTEMWLVSLVGIAGLILSVLALFKGGVR